MDINNQTTNAMQAMNCSIDTNAMSFQWNSDANTNGLATMQNAVYQYNPSTNSISCWDYWTNWYYPQIIYQSYPVYIRERAMDKGKQAFEIIKILKDKKLVNLEKVGDFIDLMDELIKIL